MNIIFIGQIYIDDQLEKFSSLGSSIDVAAHTFQSAILDGVKTECEEINVISSPYVSCFPLTKLLSVKKGQYCDGNFRVHSVPFINIPGIKHLTKIFSIRQCLKKLLSTSDHHTNIVVYGIHSPFLLSLIGLRDKRNKTCLVVPDLPEYMSEKQGVIYRIAKKVDRILINHGLKNIDSYILFSPLMTERLNIDKPFEVIEGIYQPNFQLPIIQKEKYKTILYSGNLDSRYGIMMLMDAFQSIKDDSYRLWICGDGNSVKDIQERAAIDNRIKYWGMLKRDDVLVLQKRATMLVNPRKSSEIYTRYSFPSKTMEYLASGTPTIMAHLASIPHEYDPYIFYIDDESVDGLRNKIIEVGSMSQEALSQFGEKAAEFIMTKKNNHYQAAKLLSLLNSIEII